MKFIITENKLENLVIKWLNNNYGDLEPFETKKYPDYIFFIKDNKVIFDYDKKYRIVRLNYYEIWFVLEKVFNLDSDQVRDIPRKWLEEHYNLDIKSIRDATENHTNIWNNVIN
jgi:hypothetical protein